MLNAVLVWAAPAAGEATIETENTDASKDVTNDNNAAPAMGSGQYTNDPEATFGLLHCREDLATLLTRSQYLIPTVGPRKHNRRNINLLNTN